MHLRTSTHLLLLRSTWMGALALSRGLRSGVISAHVNSDVDSHRSSDRDRAADTHSHIRARHIGACHPRTCHPAADRGSGGDELPSGVDRRARVTVTGPDAATACSQIAGTLTTATGLTWTVVPASSPIPEDDTRTLCMGKVGQSAYSVLDHPLLHIIGSAACDALGTPVTPAV